MSDFWIVILIIAGLSALIGVITATPIGRVFVLLSSAMDWWEKNWTAVVVVVFFFILAILSFPGILSYCLIKRKNPIRLFLELNEYRPSHAVKGE